MSSWNSNNNDNKSCITVDDRGPGKAASWHFVVSETTRHTRGHTLYRVTLQVGFFVYEKALHEYWRKGAAVAHALIRLIA